MTAYFSRLSVLVAAALLSGCAAQTPAPNQTATTVPASRIHYVELEGARIRVSEEGRADAPVILLLHGFTMSLESWDGWAERLSDDYRVIRYDLLGHGLTGPDPLERYSAEERVEILRRLMDALDIDQAILGGNSFGGQVAWRFAAAYPQRIDQLVLVDSGAYSIFGVTDQPAPVPEVTRQFLLRPSEAGVVASTAMIYGDPARLPAGRLTQIREMMTRPGNGEAFIAHLEEFTLPDPDADLARISVPTLILWGEEDRLIPVEQANRLAAAIRYSTLITYPGVGHAPQEEIPAETAADLRAFLEANR